MRTQSCLCCAASPGRWNFPGCSCPGGERDPTAPPEPFLTRDTHICVYNSPRLGADQLLAVWRCETLHRQFRLCNRAWGCWKWSSFKIGNENPSDCASFEEDRIVSWRRSCSGRTYISLKNYSGFPASKYQQMLQVANTTPILVSPEADQGNLREDLEDWSYRPR